MADQQQTPKTDGATEAKPKPEELGHPVPGTGEAIEPEATHNIVDPARRAGDRMWGPPGTPPKE
jgi:hypothetical protein